MSLHDKLKPGWRLLGPSTQPTTLTSGETVTFTKEALERVVENTKSRFIPAAVEHLGFLPPIGRVVDAELIEHEGHYWLALHDEALAPGSSSDLALPVAPDEASGSNPSLSVTLSTEPRNFEADDLVAIRDDAHTDVGEIALHSELPPLIWSFVLLLGSMGFLGAQAFVKEFYKQLGAASAADFLNWLQASASKAKEGDREQLAEFRIDTTRDVTVLAYCPFSPSAQESLTQLSQAIERIGDVALFVASVESDGSPQDARQIAFMWDQEEWHLAWWATNAASFVTPWLEANAPDPSRFLGGLPPTLRLLGPYVAGLPGAATPDPAAESDPPGINPKPKDA